MFGFNDFIKISVIIPVYNIEKYIEDCLKSLLNQSLNTGYYEIICIDDCSIDNSFNILYKYKNNAQNIRVYRNNNNIGAALTRNRGLKLARGKYVIFVDGDDVCNEQLLETLLLACEKNNVQVSMCNFNLYNKKNKLMIGKMSTGMYSGREKYSFYHEITTVPWNKLVLKEFLVKNKLKFQNIKNCNDVVYSWMIISLVDKFFFVAQPLYTYRDNRPGNISEYTKVESCYLEACKMLLIELKNRGKWNKSLKREILQAMLKSCYSYMMIDSIEIQDFITVFAPELDDDDVEVLMMDGIMRYRYLRLMGKVVENNIYCYFRDRIIKYLYDNDCTKIVLWGAGKRAFDFIDAMGMEPIQIEFIIDNDCKKQGKLIKNVKVCSYIEVKDYIQLVIVLNSRIVSEVKEQVENLVPIMDFDKVLQAF